VVVASGKPYPRIAAVEEHSYAARALSRDLLKRMLGKSLDSWKIFARRPKGKKKGAEAPLLIRKLADDDLSGSGGDAQRLDCLYVQITVNR